MHFDAMQIESESVASDRRLISHEIVGSMGAWRCFASVSVPDVHSTTAITVEDQPSS